MTPFAGPSNYCKRRLPAILTIRVEERPNRDLW